MTDIALKTWPPKIQMGGGAGGREKKEKYRCEGIEGKKDRFSGGPIQKRPCQRRTNSTKTLFREELYTYILLIEHLFWVEKRRFNSKEFDAVLLYLTKIVTLKITSH